MANKKEEYRRPAGMENNNFEEININLAQSPEIEEGIRAEEGPEISGTSILSVALNEGVKIPARNGGNGQER